MAKSNGAFTLTINTGSLDNFGETGRPHTESIAIRDMLQQVAQAVASGRPSAAIIDRNGNNVGSYSYGAGMINAGR